MSEQSDCVFLDVLSRGVMRKLVFAAGALMSGEGNREITGITPAQVRWFTPSYYSDGRERAQLLCDSSRGRPWIDRAKIPAGKRVLAHIHPQDKPVTVIKGTWYVGQGTKFDATKLREYPAGSFVLIPAGVPDFVATKEDAVIIQLSGTQKSSDRVCREIGKRGIYAPHFYGCAFSAGMEY